MSRSTVERHASIDAQLRLLAPQKVSEDEKLVEYDALLLDRFLDILQEIHGEDIRETAFYSANPLPVELLPIIPIYGSSHIDGIQILEVADYPLNALVFVSKNLTKLAHLVGEICSTLQRRNTVFNLLISDCGTKMFLFPQVSSPVTGRHLHVWECSGYFMYNKSSDFDDASESEISERLASVSIDGEGFQSLKQLCCGITAMIS